MLRSIIIGFAIAALLQVGVRSGSPAPDLAAVAQHLTWAQVQSDSAAFLRLVVEGCRTLTR